MCVGDAYGFVANFGGTACWGEVNFDCNAIKGRSIETDVDIGFVTFGIVAKLPGIPHVQPVAQFTSGCGEFF